ncbi:MAG: Uma2 family endonuclease [Solirubrobacterales bacterium]|nr:Uma2 family endonuclease [Solirubrobacterales bacterium]
MTLMAASTVPQRMSVEQFLALPPDPWSASTRELVDGELVVEDPTFAHQWAVLNLAAELRSWHQGAPDRGRASLNIDTIAGERSIFKPDVQWWADGRVLPDPTTRPYPLGEIVAEVRSPSTWAVDVGRKRATYEREGVAELWLVDPFSETVLVFARSSPEARAYDLTRELAAAERLESPLLPDFTVVVGSLFED